MECWVFPYTLQQHGLDLHCLSTSRWPDVTGFTTCRSNISHWTLVIFFTSWFSVLALWEWCAGVCAWVCKHVSATHRQEDLQSLLGRLGDHLHLKDTLDCGCLSWPSGASALSNTYMDWTAGNAMTLSKCHFINTDSYYLYDLYSTLSHDTREY